MGSTNASYNFFGIPFYTRTKTVIMYNNIQHCYTPTPNKIYGNYERQYQLHRLHSLHLEIQFLEHVL